jgi:hypothetical protein
LALSTRAVEVAADASWVMTTHNESLILRQPSGPARAPLGYSDATQTLEVTEAYIRKADGRTIPVPAETIASQPSPQDAAAGRADMRQTLVTYKDYEVGDTLVNTTVVRSRPLLPGNFVFSVLYPAGLAVGDASATITIPTAMPVTTDAQGIKAETKIDGDRTIYSLHYTNPDPPRSGAQAVSEFDRGARFSLSTFKDYDGLAKAYLALAAPAMAVTPKVQAQADAITQGVTDRFQQARLIHNWVAAHLRYVAVDFGQGGIVPRGAEASLGETYGDGKDHAVLFAALLKAKGIDSNLVLINAASSYAIASSPNLLPFNHLINWLPEFRLYADSSAPSTAFGLLPRDEYGKPAVRITDAPGALIQTPLSDGKTSSDTYKLVIRMDAFGHIESESSSTATGDFAAPLRVAGALMQGDNSKSFAAAVLARTHVQGATGAFIAAPPDPDATEYKFAATYALPRLASVEAGSAMRLGDDLQLLRPVSSNFYGPVMDQRFRNADPAPCFSGRSIDDETLEFPATRHLAALPRDTGATTQHVSYSAHWSQTPTSVTVHREFEARFDQPVCGAWIRDEVMGVAVQAERDIAGAVVSVPKN